MTATYFLVQSGRVVLKMAKDCGNGAKPASSGLLLHEGSMTLYEKRTGHKEAIPILDHKECLAL